ncbi:MAG: sugar phosphate isomerase/epimerase [Ruminococcaceae bacterium]|nr:sugar phosphate isomerase/epimerase [Oscillospiraceae bacterium]
MDILYEELDPHNISFVLDTCWVQVGGADVRYWIEKLSGRLDILHLKDCMAIRDESGRQVQDMTEIGNGNLWIEGIIESAEKAGVKHYIVEQDTCPGNPLDSICQSADYLKKLIK